MTFLGNGGEATAERGQGSESTRPGQGGEEGQNPQGIAKGQDDSNRRMKYSSSVAHESQDEYRHGEELEGGQSPSSEENDGKADDASGSGTGQGDEETPQSQSSADGRQRSSEASSQESKASSSEDTISSDTSSSEGDDDPEQEAQAFLEDFYNKNYSSYEIMKAKDYFHKRVWRIYFDETSDIIYVFMAKIGNHNASKGTTAGPNLEFSNNDNEQNDLIAEFDALQPYQGSVDLQLHLQVYEVYDRKIQDTSSGNKPLVEYLIMRLEEQLPYSMTLYSQMRFLQNKYADFCQLVQIDNLVYFFLNKESLGVFDNEQRRILNKQYAIFDKFRFTKFRTTLHFRDIGKVNQMAESLLIFNYVQHRGIPEEKTRDVTNDSNPSQSIHSANKPRWRQSIELRTISYEYIHERQFHTSSLRGSTQKNLRKQQTPIKDDTVIAYYENEQLKNLGSFFLQRIDDSQTYILLFPTGLLLMCGTNPFTVQAKQQLNLKRDETIIDTSYCVSPDGKSQCIWLLDQKLQVWKCSNERNPNQCNWNLVKITISSNLKIKKFFQPAMTFEDYHMTVIDKMQCFKQIGLDKFQHLDYHFAYNGTATKVLFVQQPNIREIDGVKHPSENTKGNERRYASRNRYVESRMNMTKDQLQSNRISMFVISKHQNMIINQIFEDKQDKMQEVTANAAHQVASPKKAMNSKLLKELEEENEIMEMCYMGKIKKTMGIGQGTKVFRQILIRKRHHLEIMLLNERDNSFGYHTEEIAGSEIHKPYIINDIMLSQNNTSLIAYYSVIGNETQMFIRIFNYDTNSKSFKVNNSNSMTTNAQNAKNVTLDENGEIYEIKIQLLAAKIRSNFKKEDIKQQIKSKKEGHHLHISFPKSLIFKELLDTNNQMERVLLSGDGRILMCGRVLIQLNERKDEVEEIGAIVLEKDHSIHKYKFMSLLNDQDRKVFQMLVKKQLSLHQIVRYDFEYYPVSPMDMTPVVYLTNPVDPENNFNVETSIIKLHTETLECAEIYKSKFKVIHLSMKEIKEKIDQVDITDPQRQVQSGLRNIISQQMKGKSKSINTDTDGDSDASFELSERRSAKSKNSRSATKKNGQKVEKKKSTNRQRSRPNNSHQNMNEFLDKNQADNSVESRLVITDKHAMVNRRPSLRYGDQSPSRQLKQNDNTIYLSLVSQNKNQLNVEIIMDTDIDNFNEMQIDRNNGKNKFLGKFKKLMGKDTNQDEQNKQQRLALKLMKARLIFFIRIMQKKELLVQSEAGWLQKDRLILTMNNSYFMLNLGHKDLYGCSNGINYGIQQVNMGLFASIVSQDIQGRASHQVAKRNYQGSFRTKDQQTKSSLEAKDGEHVEPGGRRKSLVLEKESMILKNETLIKSQECIQRMEIASLIRYAFIRKARTQTGKNKALLFFIPCEELSGGSIFSDLSANYNIINPYIDKIDVAFIDEMNAKIKNVYHYINTKSLAVDLNYLQMISKKHLNNQDYDANQMGKLGDSSVHMYQEDISGKNAIDNAFDQNSIFSIKAFVDSLLQLTDEAQFKNCFDKALLLMVNKGMDVKELVNSNLFYPPVWTKYTLFSEMKEPAIRPYSNELDDLEFEDPFRLFNTNIDKKLFQKFDMNNKSKAQKDLMRRRNKMAKSNANTGAGSGELYTEDDGEQTDENDLKEQYEMQYNYIHLDKIQGEDKISLTRTLKDSEDLALFEQEAIQIIIDYKWETYAKRFFLIKLFTYAVFLVTFFVDLETLHGNASEEADVHPRIKDLPFIIRKVICELIQLYFLMYEIVQFRKEKKEYFKDFWNYFELLGIFLYQWASILDITNENTSDICRILFVFSVMFSLIKVLYLIRVFRQLSFLVMMMIQVVNDVVYFMLLFVIFILTFAECYHIVQVNTDAYGRLPAIAALFLGTLRSAMGDFSLIDPYQGFDIQRKQKPGVHCTDDACKYQHSRLIVFFTFFIYVVCVFFLFMIFMNFIIAVIGESYSKVNQYATAHDYRQRVIMIYEKEIHFGQEDFDNEEYFPNILIVRKKKQNNQYVNNWQSYIKVIKNFVKDQATKSRKVISVKAKESSEHLMNSIKLLENQIFDINKDIQKVFAEISKINMKQTNQTHTINKMSMVTSNVQASHAESLSSFNRTFERDKERDRPTSNRSNRLGRQPQGKATTTEKVTTLEESQNLQLEVEPSKQEEPHKGGEIHDYFDDNQLSKMVVGNQNAKEFVDSNEFVDPQHRRANYFEAESNNEDPLLGGQPQLGLAQHSGRQRAQTAKSALVTPTQNGQNVEPYRNLTPNVAQIKQDDEQVPLEDYVDDDDGGDSPPSQSQNSRRIQRSARQDITYAGQVDVNTQHFEDIKRENRQIQQQIKQILEIQQQMQARQHLNQDEDAQKLPRLPILSQLLQRNPKPNRSRSRLTNDSAGEHTDGASILPIFGEKQYPKQPKAMNQRTYQRLPYPNQASPKGRSRSTNQ